jgi:hypothetical protein
MIDRLVVARGKDIFSDEYTASQAVQGREWLNRDAKKLAVIFPQWHAVGWPNSELTKRLKKQNWAVLNYQFHDQILEPNIERVPQSYGAVQAEVIEDLEYIEESEAYERVHFIGISLGTMAMTLVASEYSGFSSATFVLPCSKLASSMWEGSRTQGIREGLEEQGYARTQVEEAWHDLEPWAYAKAFRGKTVHSVVSPSDRIILPSYQIQMNEALANGGAHLSTEFNRLDHSESILKFCYLSGKIEEC